MKPVLYLDIDDTLLSWVSGQPAAVPGSGPFVTWAMEHFEVRWLTRWCPDGHMSEDLLQDLARMMDLRAEPLRRIQACSWEESAVKVDGIAWLEHVVLERPFAWVENRDGLTDRDMEVLDGAGCGHLYIACDVTADATALDEVRPRLEAALIAPPPPQ